MNEKQKKVVLWISVVVWMGLIFMFSAQNSTESSSLSGSVVGVILHAIKTIFPDIRQVELNHLQFWIGFFVRKAAHASISVSYTHLDVYKRQVSCGALTHSAPILDFSLKNLRPVRV